MAPTSLSERERRSKPTHIPEIDALRGLAALLVAAVFHQHYLTGDYRDGLLNGWPVFTWLHAYGWTLVDLFFVISGFIMCHVYLGEGRRRVELGAFVNARFARLYPLHVVTLLFAAAILTIGIPSGYLHTPPATSEFVLNLLMLQRSPLADGMSFNVPAWSIAIEIYCYAVFYLIARHVSQHLTVLAVVIVIVGLLATIPEEPLVRHVARGFCGFFAGALVWRWGRAVPPAVLPLVVVIPPLLIAQVDMVSRGSFLALTSYSALILLAQRIRFLRGPVFAWLGSRSYSLYLVHAPIYWLGALLFFDGQQVDGHTVWPQYLVCLAAILTTSHLSFRYLEEPARRWLRTRERSQPVTGPASI